MNAQNSALTVGRDAVTTPLTLAPHDPKYREELAAINWLLEEVRRGQPLPVIEAEAVAHSMFMSARLAGKAEIQLLGLRAMSEYGAVHALNVATLSMALAELLGYNPAAVRQIGLAGLLHDIGMVRIPVEIIAKSEKIGPAERALVQTHPIEGARIIVEADGSLELAAVTAYEHHLGIDGGGYPKLTYPRAAHRVSRLVQVCDAYHALSSPRPFRQPWPDEVIFSFLHQKSGSDFDGELVEGLGRVLKQPVT